MPGAARSVAVTARTATITERIADLIGRESTRVRRTAGGLLRKSSVTSWSECLADRAPMEVPAHHHLGPNLGATDTARQAGAPVHVVRVVALYGTAAAGTVRRAGRDDPAHPDPGAHEGDEVGPHPPPHQVVHRPAGAERGHPVPEQQFGAVDVADPGEHGLVHQQRTDRRPARGDAPVRDPAVRTW